MSAVDPVAVIAVFNDIHVNDTLFILVFGESLFNDGVAVVLYKVFQELLTLDQITSAMIIPILLQFIYIVFVGLIIGILFGYLGAVMSRFAYRAPGVEPLVMMAIPYVAYLLAEALGTSAILSQVAACLTMRTHFDHNSSEEAPHSVHVFASMIAYIMESTIFLHLGVVGWTILRAKFFTTWKLWMSTIILCSILRTLLTFGQGWLCNRFRDEKIKMKDLVIMAYGGLRGGIAYALMELANFGTQYYVSSGVVKRSAAEHENFSDTEFYKNVQESMLWNAIFKMRMKFPAKKV